MSSPRFKALHDQVQSVVALVDVEKPAHVGMVDGEEHLHFRRQRPLGCGVRYIIVPKRCV